MGVAREYFCPDCLVHWLHCGCGYVPEKVKFESLPSEFLVVDLETSGFNRRIDAIYEIGVVRVDLEGGRIDHVFHEICNELPEKKVGGWQWIFWNSSLDVEDVISAPHFMEIADGLKTALSGEVVTAFNRSFDLGFLRHRGVKPDLVAPCLMYWFRPILGLLGRKGLKVPGAQEAWNVLFPGSNRLESHRALDDARFEAKLVMRAWELLNRKMYDN